MRSRGMRRRGEWGGGVNEVEVMDEEEEVVDEEEVGDEKEG